MIALIQRVSEANVVVDGKICAAIDAGILALIGVQRGDSTRELEKLAGKLLGYRIFSDAQDRMNVDIVGAGGGLLLVPQFTLAADTSSGRRPGFSTAAPPEIAADQFTQFCDVVQAQYPNVQRGVFGADMKVALVNDGPVTFWLEISPKPDSL